MRLLHRLRPLLHRAPRLLRQCTPALCAGLAACAGVPPEPLPEVLRDLDAGTIATVSDGDMRAEGYATGELAPLDQGLRDTLTVLKLQGGHLRTLRYEVSNSVTAPPEVLALSRDGRWALVIERLQQRAPGQTRVRELAPGRQLIALDLGDPQAVRQADRLTLADFAEALALSPDGAWLAVLSNPRDGPVLQLVPFQAGRFGPVRRYPLAGLGALGDPATARGPLSATNVQWHPSGQALAVHVPAQDRVVMLRFEAGLAPQEATLRPWGAPVQVGRDPFVGRFTPDGRHYLTSDWGRDLSAQTLEQRLPQRPSSLSVVRLADDTGPAALHRRLGSVETDDNAEGLAVSRDGRLVATVNMRGTGFPPDSPRHHRDASVSLLRFDPASGSLTKLGDHHFEGVLPEGGSFDLSGRHFVATVFQGHRGSAQGAGLEVFRVTGGEVPTLQRLGRLPLPHGVHHVQIAR
ncbi:hypothetical protein [Caldimonas brevitalea]|uniref:Uncharacterized protein n=1 Tax=Caldimonas brevitalea TaxID=413882 RepID=A0A0G3BLR1_9BURK|nr:hypothetical protein [Caldimonas brevitalea]AKJ28933.1 hypothetical protein AAW51_2242 [Caldimonas brevitalea]